MRGAIDTDDLAALDDAQPFEPDGSWSGADNDAGSGGTFGIRLDNYTFTSVNPTSRRSFNSSLIVLTASRIVRRVVT